METRLEAVCETDKAQTLLEDNSLQQHVVLTTGDEHVSLRFEPHETDLRVEPGPADPAEEYELFEMTIISMDAETMDALLSGTLLSEPYLEGKLDIQGIPPVWSLLGVLFRVNAELLGER